MFMGKIILYNYLCRFLIQPRDLTLFMFCRKLKKKSIYRQVFQYLRIG